MSDTVPSDGLWQEALVEAWSEGRTAPASIRHLLRIQGLPDAPPADPYRRARLLALLTDLTIDEIVAACPGADPFKVEDMVKAIPPTAYDIIDAHRRGFTPLEMEQHLGITRTLAYHWLGQVGLKPNRRNRAELTARERREAIEAYHAGEPLSSIAKRLGTSYDQVRYAVRRAEPVVA